MLRGFRKDPKIFFERFPRRQGPDSTGLNGRSDPVGWGSGGVHWPLGVAACAADGDRPAIATCLPATVGESLQNRVTVAFKLLFEV